MCKKLLFLISFVAVLGLVGSAFAKEMHVYGYNPSAKYQTIESAYAAAVTGDTITIHGDPTNSGCISITGMPRRIRLMIVSMTSPSGPT